MKTQKVLDLCCGIHLVCIRTLSVNGHYPANPYRLYILYHARNRHGYPTQHRKCIAKYGDMASILCMIKDMYIDYVQDLQIENVVAWCKQYYGS